MRYSLLLGVTLALVPALASAADPVAPPVPAPAAPDVRSQALAVLKAHCYRCHGENGSIEGGLNFVLDPKRLIARRKLVPGKSLESLVFKRISGGTMPPKEEAKRPTADEIAVLKRWIDGGANAADEPARGFVTSAQTHDAILADLEGIDRRSRRFVRYLSLVNLANAGQSPDELQTARTAVNKLINSLSWHPKVRNPEPVDPSGTVLRIDLRWYMWDNTLWNRILADYPYAIAEDTASARAIMVSTATRVPVIRADWLIATASRSLLYHDILQLPVNLAELERQLRVDANQNIAQERVVRVAFNGSGISRNNRILERHDAVHGYYWRSYDFDEVPQNLVDRGLQAPDRRNVFAYPLGPGNLESTFQHAGGEAIFSLPNGLQAYFIMNAINSRLDKAPSAIVSDARRPDRAVEVGVSCMGCHITGVLPKADQMHDHLEKNPRLLARIEQETALSLYPAKEKTAAIMDEDSKRFLAALALTGVRLSKYEPIITLTQRYESDLDDTQAAADLTLPVEEFRKRLGASESLAKNFGSLRIEGGTISRQIWVQGFADLVKELRLGVLFSGNVSGQALPDNTGDVDPLEAQGGTANAMAFSADGRRAVIAGADRSLQLYDVEGGRIGKRLVGHTASVWSVAVSPDGKLAASGGMDGTVRYWDTGEGRDLKVMTGHTSVVSAVALTAGPVGIVSGGYDGSVILWSTATGREIRRFDGAAKYIHALAVSPDRKAILLGTERTLKLIDWVTGKEIRTFAGHTSAVSAVSFSADGRYILSGSDDRTMRLWEADTGKELRTFSGHESAVRSVQFDGEGRWVLSSGGDRTVRLWDRNTGKELGAFRRHADSVVHAAFVDNGKQTISGSRDGGVLLWSLEKFVPVAAVPPPASMIPVGPPELKLVKLNRGVPLDGKFGAVLMSKDRGSIFVVDLSASKLRSFGRESRPQPWAESASASLPEGVGALSQSADGSSLIAAGSSGGRGTILEYEPTTLKIRQSLFNLEVQPWEILHGGKDRVWMTTVDGPLIRFDLKTERAVEIQAAIWPKFDLFAGADADSAIVHAREKAARPIRYTKSRGSEPLALSPEMVGSLIASPNGRWLISPDGTVVDVDAADKLRKIAPFSVGSLDAESGLLVTVDAKQILRKYTFPDLKEAGVWALPLTATKVVADGKNGKLWLAVIDPDAVRSRPRAKGYEDLWLVDMPK